MSTSSAGVIYVSSETLFEDSTTRSSTAVTAAMVPPGYEAACRVTENKRPQSWNDMGWLKVPRNKQATFSLDCPERKRLRLGHSSHVFFSDGSTVLKSAKCFIAANH